MEGDYNIKKKLIFTVVILVGAVPFILGCIQISKEIIAYMAKPELWINHISISEHHITTSSKNYLASKLRYKHLPEKEFINNTAQTSFTLWNKTNKRKIYTSFVLAVKTVDDNKWKVFPTYIVLNSNINLNEIFNTPVKVEVGEAIHVDIDFIVGDAQSKFKKCANEFRVAWLDENMEHYKVEKKFDTPSCLYESYLSYFPVNGSAEIHGKKLNFKPYN